MHRIHVLSQLSTMQMDDAQKRALMDFIQGSTGQSIGGQATLGERQLKQSEMQHGFLQDTLAAIATKGGSLAIPKGGK
jgi:hypothetical protein